MPFQPDQMSPDSLRRLVKAQRRALHRVLGQTVPQHQAQEILAQTLGYASWHEALARVSASNPTSEADLTQEAPTLSRATGLADRLSHFPTSWPGEAAEAQFDAQLLAAAPEHLQRILTAWAKDARHLCHNATQDVRTVAQRVKDAGETWANERDQLLEDAWTQSQGRSTEIFERAVVFIPPGQLWPWLHRAARAGRRDLMDMIVQAHTRAIGQEPFCALANAVYARDIRRVEELIEAQCRRYKLARLDHGGLQRGTLPAPRRRP